MTKDRTRRITIREWLRRAYFKLNEPRFVSSVYGLAYLISACGGLWSMFNPPRTVEAAAGNTLMVIIAGVITLGGVVGVATVAAGSYWAERAAASLLMLGTSGYFFMVVYLQLTTAGNRVLQASTIATVIGFHAVRFYWINDRPFKERYTMPQRS